MARTLLDYCSEQAKPVVKEQAKAVAPAPSPPLITKVEPKKPKKPRTFPPIAPDNLPPAYFVSATYDGRQKQSSYQAL
jgi:hypothetical protein